MMLARSAASRDRLLRVFIEFGSYHSLNLGDLAMLQVAVGRLRERHPGAVIHVTNAAPERLAHVCPGVCTVPPEPSEDRGADGYLAGRFAGVVGARRRGPGSGGLSSWVAGRAARPPYPRPWGGPQRQVLESLRSADLVLVSGGGAMTDVFLPHPLMILDRLEYGARRGRVTAMVGQGMGPVDDHRLADRMRAVLPMADSIAVREPRKSAALLESLGVSGDRVRMTGDDAVELAHAHAASRGFPAGGGLGVNLRVSEYSGVSSAEARAIATRLSDHAKRHGARIVPVPISLHPGESDVATLRSMFGETSETGLTTPLQAIERTAGCRVVVTGSYHAAVFALAQGIPAIGVASSRYYADKFGGLAALFPDGCSVVALGRPGAHDRLAEALEGAWQRSALVRPALLAAAREQVAASRSAFAAISDLVDRRSERRQPRGNRPARRR